MRQPDSLPLPHLELGMQFQVESDARPLVMTVVDVTEDIVTVDGWSKTQLRHDSSYGAPSDGRGN